MLRQNPNTRSRRGFTLIELMIVVAILGIMASTAIPLFTRYQLKSKSAEVKSNLAAIQVVEESYFSEHGIYLAAAAEPVVVPGVVKAVFNFSGSDFLTLGWSPEGQVHFSYAVAVTADSAGFTTDAAADLDGNGLLQNWGFVKPTPVGVTVDGVWGCAAATIAAMEIAACHANPSTF
ncbi:MAG: prepilin-type N-terminal cleavage/methylation domain-containing protein [Myxococcota bacterium]